MRLGGKVCIITGAGSGIGHASALLFAGEGARVVAADLVHVDDRTLVRTGQSAQHLETHGALFTRARD